MPLPIRPTTSDIQRGTHANDRLLIPKQTSEHLNLVAAKIMLAAFPDRIHGIFFIS
ncbi:hypothetical protein [Phormidesmis priestleyi]|uniref:hypothetical protein n=1 Tax=Phormidesmis priestleyi TaxID=268141 RepID=UPI000AAD4576|nr:hypothetical protein [Phormidesmis priestleyi]